MLVASICIVDMLSRCINTKKLLHYQSAVVRASSSPSPVMTVLLVEAYD